MAAELAMELPNVWAGVKEVRRRVEAWLSPFPERLRQAATMVTAELLENAVKHGAPVPDCPEIRLNLRMEDDRIQISVSSGLGDGDDSLQRLHQRLALLGETDDSEKLYRDHLERLLTVAGTTGGLGLFRIAHEGGFSLSSSQEGAVLTVTASRELEST